MKILGYLTLYIRVETEEREASYCVLKCDFHRPITRKSLRNILKIAAKSVGDTGITVKKVSFVTKEEYENSDAEQIIKYTWGGRT